MLKGVKKTKHLTLFSLFISWYLSLGRTALNKCSLSLGMKLISLPAKKNINKV